MLRDLGSRDSEFIRVIFCPGSDSSPSSNESLLYSFLQTVAEIRSSLLEVAGVSSPEWSAVLLQVHNHSISQLISAKERQTDQSSKLSFPPAGPQPLYFSTYIGQRKTNRPKLKSFFFLQGSGTYAVEAVLQTSSPREGARVLVLANGAYGRRMARICEVLFRGKDVGGIFCSGCRDSL